MQQNNKRATDYPLLFYCLISKIHGWAYLSERKVALQSFCWLINSRIRLWMRCNPQRKSGVSRNLLLNSSSLSWSQSVADICSIPVVGEKQVCVDMGACRLCGQACWHTSQPKIHPCRSPSSSSSASIVRRAIQRDASMVRSGPIALTGQAFIQA